MNVVRSHPHPAEAARLVPSAESLRPDWKTAWPWLFWALWGVWLAVSALLDADLQPAMIRLLIGAAVLGYAQPKTWLPWSLALSLWVPAQAMLAPIFGVPVMDTMGWAPWVVALLPSLVGGFLGRNVAAAVTLRAKH